MLIRTEKLIGDALDWAVAKCLNKPLPYGLTDDHAYSTQWALGGPLLEAECICLNCTGTTLEPWEAESAEGFVHSGLVAPAHTTVGATMLIAGLRCLVLTHLGEEVDVPENIKCL